MHVFIISIIAQTLLHTLLATLVWYSTPKGSRSRRVLIGGVVILYLLFIVGWSVRSLLTMDQLSALLRVYNNYYIFLVLWMTYSILPIAIISLMEWRRKLPKPKATALRGRVLLIILPITIALCIWGHTNTKHPRTQTYDIALPNKDGTRELKVALITDIHIGEWIQTKEIDKLVRMVQAESPDYVLLGGDIIDYHFSMVEAHPEITQALRKLHPDPSHLFIALGNHEYYVDTDEKIEWLKSIGTLLVDSVVHLDEGLYLIGRDDAMNKQRQTLQGLLSQIPQDAPKILLEHQPLPKHEASNNHIDLALHGHTHGGQFIPFNWVVALRYPYSYGHYFDESSHTVVSSGFGVAGSTFRIGTKSEIVILNIHY